MSFTVKQSFLYLPQLPLLAPSCPSLVHYIFKSETEVANIFCHTGSFKVQYKPFKLIKAKLAKCVLNNVGQATEIEIVNNTTIVVIIFIASAH